MAAKIRQPSWPSNPSDPGGESQAQSPTPAGWYADPVGHARLRYWTGSAWSTWASDGRLVRFDPLPRRRRLGVADLEHLDFVEHVFLPEAEAAGCVTHAEEALLEGLARRMESEARAALAAAAETRSTTLHGILPVSRPVPEQPAPMPEARALTSPSAPAMLPLAPRPGAPDWTAPSTPATVPPAWTPGPATIGPPSARPSAVTRWWNRTREAVGSDLAVHGLSYVGVLLFFVGAFGLVVFAFGDVAPALRPIAELLIALTPFAAAALLLRRGATTVGRALEVMGGLLVPVMLITGFLDDNPVPQDLYGTDLALALTGLTALVAAGYALWSHRHPQSALRYLVAPVAWLSVAMATLGLGREIPDGKGVATPGAAQMAAVMAALVLSLALARLRPSSRLSGPTRTAALPGLAVIAALGLLSGYAESWPTLPVLVSGVLGVVALELLADGIPTPVVAVVEPMWWAYTSTALAAGAAEQGVEVAAVAAMSATGFVVVLEAAARARREHLALALPALGIVAALAATLSSTWWAVGALAAATVWAAGRRMAPFAVAGAALALDAATAVFPVLALLALAAGTDVSVGALTAGVLVVLAAVPARWPYLRREPGDRYWLWWWSVAGAVTLAVTVASLATVAGSETEQWMLVGSLALITASSAVGPVAPRWRAPVVAGLGTLTWLAAASVLNASLLLAVAPMAVAGLGLVAIAHLPAAAAPRPRAAGLGLTGHAMGVAAVVMAVPGWWAPVVATGLGTVGWAVTGWLDAGGRSPVGAALARVSGLLSWVAPVLTAVGLPVSVALVLSRTGLLPIQSPWFVALPVATALAYAVATRLRAPGRLTAVAAWAGYVCAWVAVVGADTRVALLAAVAAFPMAVTLVHPRRRAPVMTWTAWAAVAPAAGLAAAEVSGWFDALPVETATAATLVSVGSVLLVGSAALDLHDRPWTAHLLPERAAVLPPAAVGAGEVLLAIMVASALLSAEPAGWVFASASVAVLLTALLSRVGARAGVSVLLGWVGALLLTELTASELTRVAIACSVVVLAAAQALSVVGSESRWWARWDLPLLVSGVPVAGTALVAATGQPLVSLTFTVIGAECLLVAGRLRRHRATAIAVGSTGAVLVLVGAGTAGTGWLALAVLGISAALTGLALVSEGAVRTALQIAGAVAAVVAWVLAAEAWGLSSQQATEITAVGAATAVVGCTLAASLTRLGRSWVLVWGATALSALAVCAVQALAPTDLRVGVDPSWPVTAALAVTSVALAVAVVPLDLRWLRDLAAFFALGTLLVGMGASGLSAPTQVIVLSVLAAGCAVAVLAVSRPGEALSWRRGLMELGCLSALLALMWAVTTTADPLLLVPVLASGALLSAAVGVALRAPWVEMGSPVLACAAWLVFSANALDGNPQWVTVPIGIATLVVVALWRRERTVRGGPVASTEIVALELVGIAFLVGSALVQAVTETVAYALLGAAIGISVCAWGVVSKVRRRVAAGIGIVLASMVLLVVVPLVAVLPSLDAAATWLIILAAGLVALAVASLLDWGKATARRQLTRIAEATAGWE